MVQYYRTAARRTAEAAVDRLIQGDTVHWFKAGIKVDVIQGQFLYVVGYSSMAR